MMINLGGMSAVFYQHGAGPQTLYVAYIHRQQQIKWIRPNIMACILIGLHRKYSFGYDRCLRVYEQIQEIEQEFRDNQKRIVRAAKEEIGIDLDEMIHKRRRAE